MKKLSQFLSVSVSCCYVLMRMLNLALVLTTSLVSGTYW